MEHPIVRVGIRAVALAATIACLASSPFAAAQESTALARDATLQGKILDGAGVPVVGSRVIVRIVGGPEVYVSAPSDAAGHFEVAVPSGLPYDVVAVLSSAGERVEMPDEEQLRPGTDHELRLPENATTAPAESNLGSGDRLFLSFVEDPALVERRYVEGRVDYLDFDGFDTVALGALAAFQFVSIPQVEVGVRGAYVSTDTSGEDESGANDLELWGKLRFYSSPMGQLELAAGGLVTLPTGDSDAGIGRDAVQSKLFLALGYGFHGARLIGHLGVRMAENGEVAGVPLEGTVSPTAGLALLAPATPDLSVVLEATYEGERFEDAEDDARVFAGVNWSVGRHGTFRGGSAIGLVDDAPDAQIVAGFGWSF